MGSKSGKVFAFSVFVFDTRTGELHRNGKPLPVPHQVAQLLTVLVENGGSMVTREQLRVELWPEGEAVDYDHSINRAVSKLRAILRDRSSKPAQYIDTFSKRGYRFTADLREVEPPSQEPAKPDRAYADVNPIEVEAPRAELSAKAPDLTNAESGEGTERSVVKFSSRPLQILLAAVAIVICLATFIGIRTYRSRQRSREDPLSLGIVPFEVAGDGAAALAESFRFDLADSLAQVPSIQVRAMHSFDGLGQDESQIQARARRLNIATILFGSFTVAGDQCQLHLEFVRSSDGVHLMSLRYNTARAQLASTRDRIDRDIFQRLDTSLHSGALRTEQPPSPKAYAAYLRGRSELALWTDDALQNAIRSFQEALSYDPGYARADAGIASAYFILAQHGAGDINTNFERSRDFANKAIAVDPSLAEAHAMLGEVTLNKDWNFQVANQQLLMASDLDSSHAIYHQWLSILYSTEGKYKMALEEIDKAHAAEPDWAPPYMTEIYISGAAHDFNRADHAAEVLLRKMPDWPLAHEQNANNLWWSGKYAAAIDEWHHAATLENNAGRAQLEEQGANAFRTGGTVAYARLRLRAISMRQGISHEENDFIPSEWHAYAGDWVEVLADLQKLLEGHSTQALQIGTNPAYAPLHKNPQFIAMLARYGLPVPKDPKL